MRAKLGTRSARLESLRYWRRTVLGLAVTGALTWMVAAWFHASATPVHPRVADCGGPGVEVEVPGCAGLFAPRGSLEFRVYSRLCGPTSKGLDRVGLAALQRADLGHLEFADVCLDSGDLPALARSPQVAVRHYVYRRAHREDAWTPELVELALFDGELYEAQPGRQEGPTSGRKIALGLLAGDSSPADLR